MDTPASIFEWTEQVVTLESSASFPTLNMIFSQSSLEPAGRYISKPIKKLISGLTPRTTSIISYFERIRSNNDLPSSQVELMQLCGIDKSVIETLPESILAPMRNALVRCQANPPTTWNTDLLNLVGRDDLNQLSERGNHHAQEFPSTVSARRCRRDDQILTIPSNSPAMDFATFTQFVRRLSNPNLPTSPQSWSDIVSHNSYFTKIDDTGKQKSFSTLSAQQWRSAFQTLLGQTRKSWRHRRALCNGSWCERSHSLLASQCSTTTARGR